LAAVTVSLIKILDAPAGKNLEILGSNDVQKSSSFKSQSLV
jgi:hypothetical protein